MKRILTIIVLASIPFICNAAGSNSGSTPDGDEVQYFSNPVNIEHGCADPSVIRVGDYFYCYSTGSDFGIMKSDDLIHWTWLGPSFARGTRPDWVRTKAGKLGSLWAPDVSEINGKYVMYYSMWTPDKWTEGFGTGIGVAVADSPEGPFTDKGKLFFGDEIGTGGRGTGGNIDPFYIEDNGRNWLVWGSFQGVFITELSEDGLSLKYPGDASKVKKIGGDGWEGTYIYKKGDYFYFFGSHGTCCEGVTSTYRVQVARATSVLGPYLTKEGEDLAEISDASTILSGNTAFAGPGHNGEIMVDDNGDEWFPYHAYVRAKVDGKEVAEPRFRVLCWDKITWDEDLWPVINGGNGPSTKSVAPYFKKK